VPEPEVVLAIDVGGTKLAVGLVDDSGQVRARREVPTPDDPWPALQELVQSLADEARQLSHGKLSGVGVGCGGPMRWPQGVVAPLNIPAWRNGFPLRDELARLFPQLPVRLHNDAIALAAGEHWRGAGQGIDAMLAMVVSTGVGGGLVLGGRLFDGPTGNAGHIGHVVVDPAGPPCPCGGRGCLEAVARGPATVAWAREQGSSARDGRELAAAAREGDEIARAAFGRAGRAVGIAVAGAVALLDLDLIAIGGGLSGAGDLLFDPLREAYGEHARVSFAERTRIVLSALGTDGGLVGAAALVLGGSRYWSPD
jgi:glucokinase